MYKLIRSILFLLPAEKAHYVSMNLLDAFCSIGFCRKMIKEFYSPKHPSSKECFGLNFKNTVGLGAGFDKNARYLTALETLGLVSWK